MQKSIKIGGISTSKIELVDLLKAWIAISLAFAIVMGGLSFDVRFLIIIALAAITVGTGFLLHEMAHKLVAQRYGCFAEFRANDQMLLLAIVFSFFGFVFAAPGAVMIGGEITRRENGLVSVAGVWTNIVVAVGFLALGMLVPTTFVKLVAAYGFRINIWLGLFNMLPFWLFDGKKVFYWSKAVWFGTVAVALALMFLF